METVDRSLDEIGSDETKAGMREEANKAIALSRKSTRNTIHFPCRNG